MLARYEQPEQWQHLVDGDVPRLSAEAYVRDAAEAHVVRHDAGNRLLARCSLWWSDTPRLDGRRVGAIGHYAAADQAAGAELLEAACAALTEKRCDVAVGPMDGNTWRRYRLVVKRGSEPAFFMEPDDPGTRATHFSAARFFVLAAYRSSLCDDLTIRDRRGESIGRRLAEQDVRLRSLAVDRLEDDLRAIHDVSVEAFAGGLLYQPIPLAVMKRQYQPLLERIDPALVLLAERAGEAVGFVFGMPDLCQAARGEPVGTAILKTLATRRDRSLAGLGALLMSRFHEAAGQRGMRRVIHAMMHERNGRILALSSRYARPMRGYSLFARELC